MVLDKPLRKTNTGQQGLYFLGSKILTKISPSAKNLKRREKIHANCVSKRVCLNSKQTFQTTLFIHLVSSFYF